MYPYVTALGNLNWNSPQCGSCIAVSKGSKTIYVTAIDGCGGPPGVCSKDSSNQVDLAKPYSQHFDLAPEAFTEICGQSGVNAGHCSVSYEFVAGSKCKGNKKAVPVQ